MSRQEQRDSSALPHFPRLSRRGAVMCALPPDARGDGSYRRSSAGVCGEPVGSYWRVGVSLDDGQTYYVNIALR